MYCGDISGREYYCTFRDTFKMTCPVSLVLIETDDRDSHSNILFQWLLYAFRYQM